MASVDRTAFVERLTVPWWVWPTMLAVASLLAFEIGLGAPGLATWIPFAIVLPGTLALTAWVGRLRIVVDDDQFFADDAVLPRSFIESVETLTGRALKDALTAQLHPIAFVVQRPWINSAVLIRLNDPDDPTPYWIVSTRHPQRLADALTPVSIQADHSTTGVEATTH